MAIGPAEMVLVGVVGVFALAMLVAAVVGIVACIHAVLRDDLTSTQKLVWALLSFFVPFAGVVYFVLGKARTRATFADLGQPAAAPTARPPP